MADNDDTVIPHLGARSEPNKQAAQRSQGSDLDGDDCAGRNGDQTLVPKWRAMLDPKEIGDIARKEGWHVNVNDLHISSDLLGEGSTSMVYKGKWKNMDVAVKIERMGLSESLVLTEIRNAYAIGEHPRLVTMLGACLELKVPMIVYELHAHGTLESLLSTNGSRPQTPTKRTSARDQREESIDWILDLLSALAFMHSHSPPIAHRDVKPGNLFLHLDGRLRLGDFGLSKPCSGEPDAADAAAELLTAQCGSFRYMAPEVVRCEAARTEKVDVWSAGLVMWSVVTRHRPFDELEGAAVAEKVAFGHFIPPLQRLRPPELAATVAGALQWRAEDRVSARALLERVQHLKPLLCKHGGGWLASLRQLHLPGRGGAAKTLHRTKERKEESPLKERGVSRAAGKRLSLAEPNFELKLVATTPREAPAAARPLRRSHTHDGVLEEEAGAPRGWLSKLFPQRRADSHR